MFFLMLIMNFLTETPVGAKFYQKESFEGIIVFKKQTLADTTKIIYYVKDNLIKIEYCNLKNKIGKYKIIDTQTGEIRVVNPDLKLIKIIQFTPDVRVNNSETEITKTENLKIIDKHECRQWIIKNKITNTLVIYWIAEDDLYELTDFFNILQKTDNSFDYFFLIPEKKGLFPVECTERSLLWEYRMSVNIMEIKKQKLSQNIFKIPENYQLFE